MEVTPELFALIKTSAESAPFSKLAGIVVEALEEGYARVRLPYREALSRTYGIVHGGALLTLMDVTGGLASATSHEKFGPGVTNVTIASSTQFLGTVRAQDLVGEGRVSKAGKSISFVDVAIRAGEELVAKGAFTFKTTMINR